MATISPSMVIAAAGMLQGTGIGVSPAMINNIANFTAKPIASGLTSLMNSANIGNVIGMSETVSSVPSFLSGIASDGSKLADSIMTQANKIMPSGLDGMKKFSSFLGQSTVFGTSSMAWLKSLQLGSSMNFSDFGMGINNLTDLASGGVGKLMGAAQGLEKQASAAMGDAFKSFGSMFDIADMKSLGNPASLINNLAKQGLAEVGGLADKIKEAGFDVNDLASVPTEKLNQILSTVKGSDLKKILDQTGMQLPSNISLSSLSDVMNMSKILPPNIASALNSKDLSSLGNSMMNIGGQFKNVTDISSMMKSIEFPSLPNLSGLTSVIPSDISSVLKPFMGAGVGEFGNPLITDIIGTASGHVHTGVMSNMSGLADKIMGSTFGINVNTAINNLKSAVDSSFDPGTDPSVISAKASLDSAISALNNSGNLDLQNVLNTGAAKFGSSLNQLTTEASNIAAAGIDFAQQASSSVNGILGMASKLQNFGVDKMKLGFNDMFENMSIDNLYGDAIKAALAEGKNIANLSKYGIRLPNNLG